jgi:hypothetical protein
MVMDDNQVRCERCGFVWVVPSAKRGRNDLLCQSCRAKPAVVLSYRGLKCQPWQGAFGEDLVTPFFDGEPFMPGLRVCGHNDCCNPNHVQQ